MPSVPSISFNVRFDLTGAPSLLLTDTTTYPVGAIGIFTVTQPDGYVRTGNFATPDITSSGGTFSTNLRLSATGGAQCGTYIIKYEIKTTDDVVSTFTRNFVFQYEPVGLVMVENFDVFTPNLSYSDGTTYSVSGYTNTAPTRAWTAVSTPTGTKTSTTAAINLQHNGNYYDAVYTITLASTLTYTHQTYAWLTVLETISKTVTAEACTPEPIEDLIPLIETLRQQAIECNGDFPDFEKAQTLFSHLTDMLRVLLLGGVTQQGIYDVYEDLLVILRNNQSIPCVHTNLPIPPYDLGDYAVSQFPIDAAYCTTVGDGVNTVYSVTHNLNDDCVIVQVYEVTSGAQVLTDVTITSNNSVNVSFATAPATNAYKVVVHSGNAGMVGPGLEAGGTTGQFLRKQSTTDYDTYWDTLDAGDIPDLSATYLSKAVYDIDNDGIVDDAEKITIIARNSTGATIHKGKIVYLQGSTGNRPNMLLAQANSEATSSKTFGVVVEDVANNSDGHVAAIGTLHDLDTRSNATNPFTNDTLIDGDLVWLSATNPGYITRTPPTQPNHTVFIGIVARTSPTNGRIVYKVQNGFELQELHNVLITSVADKDTIYYDLATGLWKNTSKGGWLGGTASQFIKGDGTLDSNTYLTTGSAASTYVALAGSYSNPSWITDLAWSKITGAPAFLTTETDPVFTSHPAAFVTNTRLTNWDAAYTWVNGFPSQSGNGGKFLTTDGSSLSWASIVSGVSSFNTRTGAVTLTSADVTTALGYTPVTNARTLTINGVSYDLSADRSWTVVTGGTVTSVALSVPTGLVITSGSPITTSGTIAIGLQSGYSIPTTIKQSNWDDAYTFVSGFPTQTGNSGKYLTTDGSTLSWGTVSTANIYNSDGTLTGNRVLTTNSNTLVFRTGGVDEFTFTPNNGSLPPTLKVYNSTYGGAIDIGYAYFKTGGSKLSLGTTGAQDIAIFTGGGQKGNIFSSTGNWLIQTGGTFSDAGYKLDVQGTFRVSPASNQGFQVHAQTVFSLPNYVCISGQAVTIPSSTNWNFAMSNNGNQTLINAGQRIYIFIAGTQIASIGEGGTGDLILQNGGTFTNIASSQLTINSTTKGFLPPRMTETQRNAISTPATGLSIYNTTTNTNDYYNGTSWVSTQSSITTGNLTETGSSILTISGGTGAVIGSGTTIQVSQASGSTSGFLSSTNWTTFNNKQDAITLTTTGTSGAATLVGSTLNIPQYSGTNIYNSDGTLTGNRVVTLNSNQLVYRDSSSTLQNYTYSVGVPTGVSAGTWPSSVIYEAQYLISASSAEPFNTRLWGRNQSASIKQLWVNQVYADITGESTGAPYIYNQTFNTRRGSQLDTSTASGWMEGLRNIIGHAYTGSQSTTTQINTSNLIAYRNSVLNYVGNITNVFGVLNELFQSTTTTTQNSTITNYYGYYTAATVGTSSGPTATITNYYGVYLNTPSVGATGAITNRWGLYAPDSAMNHSIVGNTVIGGSTLSAYKLDVQGTARVAGTLRQTQGGNNYIDIIANANGSAPYIDLFYSGTIATRINSYVAMGGSFSNGNGILFGDTSGNSLDIKAKKIFATDLIETKSNLYLSGASGNRIQFFEPGVAYRGNIGVQNGTSYIQVRTGSATNLTDGTLSTIFDDAGSVGIGGITSVNASARLQIDSSTKGFLPPRMTSAQRTAIGTPAVGLVVYQTDASEGLYENTSTGWRIVNAAGGGSGTVTTVSVVSANGFAGTVANATTTPAITLSTTITGLLKGNGTAISAAVAGTDYLTPADEDYSVTSQTSNYTETVTRGTKIIKCDTTGGGFTVTLPTAAGNKAVLIIKKVAGSGALTVDGAGTETIDGGLTATLNKVYESITLISDNTNWQIV